MEVLFERKGKAIKTIETGKKESFDSINKAKKKSHELQLKNGGLGNGSLVRIQ